MSSKEVQAGELVQGDIVELKTGANAVSRIITYPHPELGWNMLDVFFFGQTYPLYYKDSTLVEVVGHIDVEAVQYAVEELRK